MPHGIEVLNGWTAYNRRVVANSRVEGSTVNILAIVSKGKVGEWLRQFGEP
jgi:hypothetical protein